MLAFKKATLRGGLVWLFVFYSYPVLFANDCDSLPDDSEIQRLYSEGFYDEIIAMAEPCFDAEELNSIVSVSAYLKSLSQKGRIPEIMAKMQWVDGFFSSLEGSEKAEYWLLKAFFHFKINQVTETRQFLDSVFSMVPYPGRVFHRHRADAYKIYAFTHYLTRTPEDGMIMVDSAYANLGRLREQDLLLESEIIKIQGALWDAASEPDSAAFYYQKALDLIESNVNGPHPDKAYLRVNLANVYQVKGYNFQAKDLYLNALKGLTELMGEDHFSVGVTLNNLGIVYLKIGALDEALVYTERGLNNLENNLGKDHINYAIYLSNLAAIYNGMGRFEEAAVVLAESLATRQKQFPENHPMMVPVYVNLAEAYLYSGQVSKALEIQERAEKLIESGGGMNAFQPKVIENMANIFVALGDMEKAALKLDEAEQFFLQKYGNRTTSLATIYQLRGDIYAADKKWGQAKESYQKGLSTLCFTEIEADAFCDNIQAPGEYLGLIFSLARAKNKLGQNNKKQEDRKEALDTYLAGAKVYANFWMESTVAEDKFRLGRDFQDAFHQAIVLAKELMQKHQLDLSSEIGTLLDIRKSAYLKELINQTIARKGLAIPDSLIYHEEQLNTEMVALRNQLLQLADSSALQKDSLKALYTQRQYQKNNLLNHFRAEYPIVYEFRDQGQMKTISEIQKRLAFDQLLIEYIVGEGEVMAWVLSSDENALISLGDQKDLKKYLPVFRKSVQDPNDKQYVEPAIHLQRLLVKPIEKAFPDFSEWIIVPDGPLSDFPFEALLDVESKEELVEDPKNWPWLIKSKNIYYAFSSRLWLDNPYQQREKSLPWAGLKVLGMAPYTNSEGTDALPMASLNNDLPLLPGSRDEIQILSSLFAKGEYYLGQKATETVFRSKNMAYDIVHLAAHAEVDRREPWLSKLYFQADEENDGVLHAYELFTQSIPSRLVTLSACNTGTGKWTPGEGSFSMARVFAYSGTSNLLSSLWTLPDASTSKIMAGFYEALAQGEKMPLALRSSKIQYLAQSDRNTAHPYYWAGSIYIGKNEALMATHKAWVWGIIAGFLLLFTAFLIKKRIKA